TAIIKASRRREYIVVWNDLYFGGCFFIQNRILITPKFVENSIRTLSRCEKIVVRNDFEEARE
ncbi:MAG: hypothetical protein IJX62_09105, partial [Clostridia bacterium]|nr:hypothetical protein [Clostridia bacterium]